MSGRKLNAQEQKLHQAALADSKHVRGPINSERNYVLLYLTDHSAHDYSQTLTQKECEVLIPDPSARTAALNFLLGTVRLLPSYWFGEEGELIGGW